MTSLLDLLKQKKKDLAAGKRTKTYKAVNGRGRYRILPSWRGEGGQFWHEFGQHFVKNAAKELKAVYVCTKATFGQDCDVCSAIAQGIKGATDDDTVALLKDAKAGNRVLFNALHLDGPSPNEVVILELPASVFGNIVEIAQEWEEAGESLIDPEVGKDLIITREGTGLNTKYSVVTAAKSKPVSADVLKRLHDLDAHVQAETSDAEQRALAQVREVAGLLPAPTASKAKTTAANTVIDEDDDPYASAETPAQVAAKKAVAPKKIADEEITDVPELDEVEAKPAKTKPAAAATDDEVAGDADLDALIASLD